MTTHNSQTHEIKEFIGANGPSQESAEAKLIASLNSSDPEAQIQSIPREEFYWGIKSISQELLAECLAYASNEQFTAILDIDCWKNESLQKPRAMEWLLRLQQFDGSGKLLLQRFRSLEEEYQLALISCTISFVDEEEYETLSEQTKTTYTPLPDSLSHYKILSDDYTIQEFMNKLIEVSMDYDFSFTFQLLTHACYIPPNESEALLNQFRNARLIEDGFITTEQVNSIFVPLYRNFSFENVSDFSLPTISQKLLLDNVLDHLKSSNFEHHQRIIDQFYLLTKNLCIISKVQPNETHEIHKLFSKVKGLCSLGIEVISTQTKAEPNQIILDFDVRDIFRAALTPINQIRIKIINKFSLKNKDKLLRLLTSNKLEALISLIEKEISDKTEIAWIGFINSIFDRLPTIQIQENNILKQLPIDSLQRVYLVNAAVDDFQIVQRELDILKPQDKNPEGDRMHV